MPEKTPKVEKMTECNLRLPDAYSNHSDDNIFQKQMYVEMWSHFDKMLCNLNEDDVNELYISISNLIGSALEKERLNRRNKTKLVSERVYRRCPKQKYMEMWCNFDRMISKLSEDDVNVLNINIGNSIGAFKKRNKISLQLLGK